jgi:hypothetical protein
VRERQLRFTGHCLRLPAEEPANLYILYEYKINTKPKLGRPRHTFLKQISNYLTRDVGLLSVWKKLSDTPRTSRIGSFLLPRLTSPSDDDDDDDDELAR